MRKKITSGFTLIEIMIVNTIIVILAGLAGGVISGVLRRNKITATKAAVQKLEAALEAYHSDTGVYPPTPEDHTLNAEVFCYLTGDMDHNKVYDPNNGNDLKRSSRWRGPYLKIDQRSTDNEGNLLDIYGMPFRYFENETEAPKCDSNPTTFLLYSCGQDRKATDETREDVIDYTKPYNKDNIKNWEDE